jgi:hypothetical protein
MLVMTLDLEIAPTTTDIGQLALCGDSSNRWADKSVASVVFRNGVDGFLSEVSWSKYLLFVT